MLVRSRRPVRRGGSVSRRRKLVWATNSGLDQVVAPAAVVNSDLLTGLRVAGQSVLGATVVRTHMRIQVGWDPAATFPTQAFTMGLTAADMDFVAGNLVTPAERGRNWALLDAFLPGTGVNVVATAGEANHFEGFLIDLRSKRKVAEANQTWCFAVQATGGPLTYSFWARTLVALP